MTSSKKDALQSAIAACGGQREKLRSFAAEIVASLSELPSSGDSDPLDIFVAELVLSAAKERGVRFGPRPAPLPDDFDECHQAWRDGLPPGSGGILRYGEDLLPPRGPPQGGDQRQHPPIEKLSLARKDTAPYTAKGDHHVIFTAQIRRISDHRRRYRRSSLPRDQRPHPRSGDRPKGLDHPPRRSPRTHRREPTQHHHPHPGFSRLTSRWKYKQEHPRPGKSGQWTGAALLLPPRV